MEPIQGNVSIDAQNIMPIIKKWLYSDKDIFIREVVSIGCDAITKLRMVDSAAAQGCSIHVEVDKAARELRFIDDGVGMTEDEYRDNISLSLVSQQLQQKVGEGAAETRSRPTSIRSRSPARNPSWRNTPRTRIRKIPASSATSVWASIPCL